MEGDTKVFANVFDIHAAIGALAQRAHRTSTTKGFWSMGVADRNQAELIALMHSELSEALEALRVGNPPDKHLPQYNSVEVELADTFIRMLDFVEAYGMTAKFCEALLAKMAFNETREHKHGGKRF